MMNISNKSTGLLLVLIFLFGCDNPQKTTQYPSPMEEHIRPHERVVESTCKGETIELTNIFAQPAYLFIPNHIYAKDTVNVAIHFHGSAKVIEYAACQEEYKLITISINLGNGSSTYERPLQDPNKFAALLESVKAHLNKHNLYADEIMISGFSAGYGAIRAILADPAQIMHVNAVLLLDGFHTDYEPKGLPVFQGGKLNEAKLKPFLKFAKSAMNGEKKMLITHSSIFPGTYASTTECSEYLINALNLSRKPVLLHGPVGMQQVGTTEKGNLKIWAFAGNTAPDHIDHLHGYYYFIKSLLD